MSALGLAACIAFAAPAAAQEGEIILDPELAGTAPARTKDAEIIDDPELAGTTAPPAALGAPSAERSDLRVVLRSRLGLDLSWDDPREDVWEATQLALFEARIRKSERLSFSVGMRAQHFFAARQDDTRDARAERYELDVSPTALHADVGLGDNVNTRIGYQGVHLGRFDVLGGSDVLSRYDLRSGATVMPEQSEIAQPAISADWDIVQGVALRGIYVPFFAPHRINALEGDYALAPRQADIDNGLRLLGAGDPDASAAEIAAAWRGALSRSGQARFFESGISAFAPDPSLANPQAALRLTAHGPAGEVGLTAASALEHFPTLRIDKALGLPVLHYGRFGLLALDAATEIGPVLAGIELAYQSDRALIASLPRNNSRVAESDLVQGALRAELVHGERWVAALETSLAYMLADPGEGERWLFTVERRLQIAVVAFLAHAVPSIGLTLELAGGFVAGPTYLIAPRIELRLWEQLYAEVGASIVGGGGPPSATSPSATLGSVYDDTDQGFVGLRWVF